MQQTILHSSLLSGAPPLSFKFLHFHKHKKLYTKINAASRRDRDRDRYGSDYDGKLIDDNMIVLRKRIQEMKIIQRNNNEIPCEWMEWEKKYYAEYYNSDVCEAVGILQSVLMNTRPSLALGMIALCSLIVPTSFLIIMFNLWGCISF